MSGNTDYRPVSCDFHDHLEELAVTRRRVRLALTSDAGEAAPKEGLIVDIYTTDRKEEFLRLEDGSEIRLDRIQAVDALA
jgi:Rho-binding antiterminator